MSKFKLLSIDGGGIRGIIPAVYIMELERALNRINNRPNGHISDYFDMISGTSTGSILTCLYLCPNSDGITNRFTTTDALNFYKEYSKTIFSQPNLIKRAANINGIFFPKYGTKGFSTVLDKTFNDTKLSQLLKPCIITSYNIREKYSHFFTSHDAYENNEYDFYLKDLIRAASAAPTYFKPALIKSVNGEKYYPLVDGGVYANNPALCGYSEIYEEFQKEPQNMIIISVGTGKTITKIKYKSAKNWGVAKWITPLFDIIINAGPDVADYQLKTIFSSINRPNQYVRLNPTLPKENADMTLIDNVSESNIENLIEYSIHECKKIKNIIEETAVLISENL